MKRITLLCIFALLTSTSAWAIPITLNDSGFMSGSSAQDANKFTLRHLVGHLTSTVGVEHVNGPGTYEFEEGGTLPFVVTNTGTLAKALGIKGLKNGEHILLQHIKNDRFELRHEATGQKAALRIPVKP